MRLALSYSAAGGRASPADARRGSPGPASSISSRCRASPISDPLPMATARPVSVVRDGVAGPSVAAASRGAPPVPWRPAGRATSAARSAAAASSNQLPCAAVPDAARSGPPSTARSRGYRVPAAGRRTSRGPPFHRAPACPAAGSVAPLQFPARVRARALRPGGVDDVSPAVSPTGSTGRSAGPGSSAAVPDSRISLAVRRSAQPVSTPERSSAASARSSARGTGPLPVHSAARPRGRRLGKAGAQARAAVAVAPLRRHGGTQRAEGRVQPARRLVQLAEHRPARRLQLGDVAVGGVLRRGLERGEDGVRALLDRGDPCDCEAQSGDLAARPGGGDEPVRRGQPSPRASSSRPPSTSAAIHSAVSAAARWSAAVAPARRPRRSPAASPSTACATAASARPARRLRAARRPAVTDATPGAQAAARQACSAASRASSTVSGASSTAHRASSVSTSARSSRVGLVGSRIRGQQRTGDDRLTDPPRRAGQLDAQPPPLRARP